MPTSVALSAHLEAFVREQVDAGRYNNVSEVVREGLRLLERRQEEDQAKLEALRRAVAAAVAAVDEGDFAVVAPRDVESMVTRVVQRTGITVARSTATTVTLFCGEPSMTRSE